MIRRIKNILKTYPVITGIAGIVLLMAFIVLFWYRSRLQEISPTVITEELSREQNAEKLEKPEEAVVYILEALKNKDIDQAMRVFPIDEICLNIKVSKIINKNNEFSVDTAIAPSGEEVTYFPLSSAELTGKYAARYEELSEELEEIKDFQIEEVEFVEPKKQLEADYQLSMMEECEIFGANAFCEMRAYLTEGKKQYKVSFTLISYDDYWKIFQLGSKLDGSMEKIYTTEGADDSRNISDASKKLEKELTARINKESDKTNQKISKKKLQEQTNLLNEGKCLLPANYFVVNAIYGENPEQLMKMFVKYTQKKDLTAVLAMGSSSNEQKSLQNTSIQSLEQQGEFAERLKYFYLSLFMDDVDKQQSLQELGMNGTEIVEKLGCQYLFYLELKEMFPREENEYDVYFKYEGEYLKYQFTFAESEEGWQIQDIKNADRLTEKKYMQQIEELKEEK